MNQITEDILMHYGVKKRSGRYPWGSGDEPYQHSGDFLSRVEELKGQGLKETEVASAMGLKTTELRIQEQLAKHERRNLEVARAKSLRTDGYTLQQITEIMGYKNDSSIRSLLDDKTAMKKNQARVTADILKKEVDEKRMIDVGADVERVLGISETKMKEALYMLELEGYNLYGVGIPQPTNKGQQTNTKVLCAPDVTYREVYVNMDNILPVENYHSTDGGKTFHKLEYPATIDSSRVHIRYNEDGGIAKDGVLELRRGVKDLELGASHYAQVRVLVDDTHYLKGMAMYSDDMPDGVDVIFNTNKTRGTAPDKVFKKIKDDPDNPFGAAIKANGQSYYDDPNGKYTDPITGKKQSLSAINKIKEEGDWDSMSKNLSSQFLSKQPIPLIRKQLDLTYDGYVEEFDELRSLDNPTIKRKMLEDFANNCESAVVHLKAAALPRQTTQVILPVNDVKETEIYAPNYKNGERVALVRYPHGGTFEIPELVVNNKNPKAKAILGENIKDAVGINAKVAERLSGADFDGDQVVVIPVNDRVKVKTTPALKDLKDFDAKTQYSTEGRDDVKLMTKDNTQKQMGVVSNLITDMTLRGATPSELARAVKHSMVVIDAEKHKLDYKQSEKDNGIAELKKKYQKQYDEDGNVIKEGGASTLLSRRKQDVRIDERQGSGTIDPETGKVTYKESGRTYKDKDGNVIKAQQKVKLMAITEDVHTLSSGTPQEEAYADYANKMKALANTARKEFKATPTLKYSSPAKAKYSEEVKSLNAKVGVAAMNSPRERRALVIANSEIKAKIQANPGMDKKEIKKARHIAMNKARDTVGAKGRENRIVITDSEWEAIQAGAISDSKLMQVLRYADADGLRERATPRGNKELPQAKINKIKSMQVSGYTNEEIAASIGASVSSVHKYLR